MNIQDIQLILDHFEEPIFPRTISTKATQGKQIPVYNIEEAYRKFEDGCSGWSDYSAWQGPFYPSNLDSYNWLQCHGYY